MKGIIKRDDMNGMNGDNPSDLSGKSLLVEKKLLMAYHSSSPSIKYHILLLK